MNSFSKYEIQFSGLAAGTHDFDWDLEGSFFEDRNTSDIMDAKLKAEVKLLKTERMLTLNFAIAGQVKVICDHCGDEFWLTTQSEDELIARFASETDLTGDEVIYLGGSEHTLDISQYLFEFVLLSLPAKRIHPEGECNPDVEQYFIQEETKEEQSERDPRWDALEKLKK